MQEQGHQMKPHKERLGRNKRRWFIKVFEKALVILNMHRCKEGLRKLTEEKLLQNTYKCLSWKCLLKAENVTGFAFAWATEGCCQVYLMSERGDEMGQRGLLGPWEGLGIQRPLFRWAQLSLWTPALFMEMVVPKRSKTWPQELASA